MDLGTGVVAATSVAGFVLVILKIISVKTNNNNPSKFVYKDVYKSEYSSLKELMEKGFEEVGRRLTSIEGKI